jgi:hypothetical protein
LALVVTALGCTTSGAPKAAPPPPPAAVQPVRPEAKPEQKKEKIIIRKIPRIVKESFLFEDGSVDEYRIFSYSADGKFLLKEELFDADSGELLETVQYTYQDELVTERKSYDRENKLKGKKTYTYNGSKLPATENLFDKNETIQAVSKYSYNPAGGRTEWQTLDAAGVILASTRYEYQNGRLWKILLLGPGGKLDMDITVSYDDKGRKTREVFAGSTGKAEKEIAFSYDEKDRLTSETTLSANKAVLGKIMYEYSSGDEGPVKTRYLDGREKVKKISIQEFAFREEKKVIYE